MAWLIRPSLARYGFCVIRECDLLSLDIRYRAMQIITLLKPHGGVNPAAKFRFRLLTTLDYANAAYLAVE